MTRILALVAGLLLIAAPAWWLREAAVPVPAYRKGGYADFVFLGQALLAVYGGVLLGVVAYWARARRTARAVTPFGLIKAGVGGVRALGFVFFVGGAIYSQATYGSFDKAIGGNLWGLLVIFWAILGALVSAGLALLFYAWRGPAPPAGVTPGKSASGVPRWRP